MSLHTATNTKQSQQPIATSTTPLVCVDDYEDAARSKLSAKALGYYSSGAMAQTTLRENKSAMNRWYILPRMLRDVSQRSMATTVLGHHLSMPVAIAPTGFQKMAHPEGECASVAAAGAAGTIFTLSSIANSSIEEIAEHDQSTVKFFQIYFCLDRDTTERLVRRAKKNNYEALVLTIDCPTYGKRRIDERNGFTIPSHLRLANFAHESENETQNIKDGKCDIRNYLTNLFSKSQTWSDVKWLISITKLPVIVKGVVRREDARSAMDVGVAAVWVSNHGGRQAECAPPTIEVLPHIVDEVQGRCPVFVDGGFSQGTDIFKALALGADLVLIGRPVLWGLACGGQRGVKHVLDILAGELDNIMANSGCSKIKDINKSMVVRKDDYCKSQVKLQPATINQQ